MAGLFDGTPLEQAVTCEICHRPLDECECPRNGARTVCRPCDQQARVQREKRRGKWVTIIRGLDPQATDLKALIKSLKSVCSAGGTITEDGVLVQGDHRDRIVGVLLEMGYPAKASGG